MIRTTLPALGALALAFLAGLFVAACQDDSPSLTGATSVTAEAVRLETTTASESSAEDEDGDDGATDDSDDDDSGDVSDDDSGDADSGDVSDDDDSGDDSTDDHGNVDVSEVKGLFFGTEVCPASDCLVGLRIKDTLVAVTSGTEIVNQAAGDAPVSPSDLEALVAGHPGLPMRAEGASDGGVLVAQKLRIDDEVRATGVVADAPGCDFGLAVQFVELCFGLSPGMTLPTVGSTVRVEGLVPGDFSLPFLATRIEPSDD